MKRRTIDTVSINDIYKKHYNLSDSKCNKYKKKRKREARNKSKINV